MAKMKDELYDKQNSEPDMPPKNRYRFLDEKGQHLHTLDGNPLVGTSSVSGVLAKPLTWWAAGLACEKFGWINKGNAMKGWTKKELRLEKAEEMREKIEYMSTTDYLDLLDEAYSAHSKKLTSTAKTGTDLHAELEKFVNAHMGFQGDWRKLNIVTEQFDRKIDPFIKWVEKNIKRFLWSEMYCYSEKLWVGGITDCGYEKLDGTYGIMDFKSSKEAYLGQFWQCAGYHIQIEENGGFDKNGNKIFTLDKPITEYAIFPFGMTNPQPQFNYDIQGGQDAFRAEVLLYKKLN